MQRVIVRIRDTISLPPVGALAAFVEAGAIGPWAALSVQHPGLVVRPLFDASEAQTISILTQRAIERHPGLEHPDLLRYFAVLCPDIATHAVAAAIGSWPGVRTAYVESKGSLPQPILDPHYAEQGYLKVAPEGIDAEFAWQPQFSPGGLGQWQTLIDIEGGWKESHADFTGLGAALQVEGGRLNRPADSDHGTRVLGVIAATHNNSFIAGITPQLMSARLLPMWNAGGEYDLAGALTVVLGWVQADPALAGSILLIEVQANAVSDASGLTWSNMPVETEPLIHAQISLFLQNGVVVLEAAGNGAAGGGQNLDNYRAPPGAFAPAASRIFNRNVPGELRDSGAILIGAGTYDPLIGFSKSVSIGGSWGSNYGSRVDCFSWGMGVWTLASPDPTHNDDYTQSFQGTSAAAAIVAGAALSVQGIAQQKLGRRFAPWQLRTILGDPANGTLPVPSDQGLIGVQPDLRKILENNLTEYQDGYVRDRLGDVGIRPLACYAKSPDIIVRNLAVVDPTLAFGTGSGTEDSDDLNDDPVANAPSYVHVRIRNRGTVAALNVRATVYATPLSPLSPSDWKRIGSVVIPKVEPGDVLAVSDPFEWVPTKEHADLGCCYLCILSTEDDPASLPEPSSWTRAQYQHYTTANNNVAIRGLLVIRRRPHYEIRRAFRWKGCPWGELNPPMPERLEIIPRLPLGSIVELRLPLDWVERAGVRIEGLRIDRERGMGIVALRPGGAQTIFEGVFSGHDVATFELAFTLPEGRAGTYEIVARQVEGHVEVGRITWSLREGPARKRQPSSG